MTTMLRWMGMLGAAIIVAVALLVVAAAVLSAVVAGMIEGVRGKGKQ